MIGLPPLRTRAEARLVQYIRNNDVYAFVEADLATAIAALEV